MVKKAQQRLFNLKMLMRFDYSPKTLIYFYRCTFESILSGCITSWYGNCTTRNRKGDKLPGENCLPSRPPTAPDFTGRPKR